jgi:hypothetical protein
MKINVVDCKRNEMINVKVELSEHMFIVVPEIVNHKFDYMKYKLMDIRKKYMDLYLENKGQYKVYEQQIYDEIKETLIKEMERIYKTEGVMYYTR